MRIARSLHPASLGKIGLIVAIAAVIAAGMGRKAAAQAPTTFQNVGSMSQLMINIIYPTSDAIFYVDRDTPKTDADWNALANQALMLAESGNLLMMPGRARDQENWIRDSKMMVDAGAAAFKAARAKNIEAVRAVNDQLYQSCVTCHQQYRPNYPGYKPPQPKQ
jgi:cytochrome c556